MSNDNVILYPIKHAKKRAPSAAEIERVKMQVFRDMAAIGAENAIHLLVPMLASFLWSEHLPPRGREFDAFMGEIKRAIREQIETLEADAAAPATPTHTHIRKETAMRGIETAFWGVLGKDPELKMSKTGKAFATMNVVVTVGQSDENRDVNQWLRVACFGEAAEKLADRAKMGDRVYCEGTLTLNTWNDKATGEIKTGLNVAAWKCEKVPGIGKNRPRRENGQELSASSFAGPAPREKPHIQGRDRFDFDDELSF